MNNTYYNRLKEFLEEYIYQTPQDKEQLLKKVQRDFGKLELTRIEDEEGTYLEQVPRELFPKDATDDEKDTVRAFCSWADYNISWSLILKTH